MKRGDARSRIIDAARRLFNKHGTTKITTTHIAKAAKVSPGTLYYHFKDKEEIIREIYEQMNLESVDFWYKARVPSLEDLREAYNRAFPFLWNYRFLHREVFSLLNKDPELKRRYRAVDMQRRKEGEWFMEGLVESGVIRRPGNPAVLPSVIKIMWLIQESWLSYLTVNDLPINRKNVQEGIDLVFHILEPYLSEEAQAWLQSREKG